MMLTAGSVLCVRRMIAPAAGGGTAPVLVLLTVLVGAICAPEKGFSSGRLENIRFAALPGDRVQIALSMSAEVPAPVSFTTDDPARISLDFPGVSSALAQKTKAIGLGMVRSVTAVEAKGRTRVVVNLVALVPYSTRAEGNTLLITIGDIASTTTGATIAEPPAAIRSVENVDFRRGESGEGRVLVTLLNPSTVVDIREEGETLVLDFLDASLPERLSRRLDVTDFATPVTLIDTYPLDNNVRMVISAQGEYEHLSYQTDELFTTEFRLLTPDEQERLQRAKVQYIGERLSLNFQDIQVRAVLELLADFNDLNLVTSDTVQGSITLRLKDIPWDQAMDIIMRSKGLTKRELGNVMLVAPTEEIAARERQELQARQQVEELAPLRREFIQVHYASAKDLAAMLQSKENSFLSTRGGVTVDERTNTLLVRDTAATLADIRRVVKRLDVPVRQVMIEARIVIANNDFTRDLGARFGYSAERTHNDQVFAVGGGLPGNLDVSRFNQIFFEGDNENLLVNLPAAGPVGAVNFLIGEIGGDILRLELSAMEQEGRGEVISNPRVITSDQSQAVIKQGVEIPFQTISESGTKTDFKEAVLQLLVTPQITPDDRINMDLKVSKDSADFSNIENSANVPINKQEVSTTVLVDNGETIVLGGIFEATKSKAIKKVPILGDLPWISWLFRQTLTQDLNRELLIFVTPRIVKENLNIGEGVR